MNTFQFNFLMQFLVSATCFEDHVLIIRKTICTCSFYMVCFPCVCLSSLADGGKCCIQYTVYSRWREVLYTVYSIQQMEGSAVYSIQYTADGGKCCIQDTVYSRWREVLYTVYSIQHFLPSARLLTQTYGKHTI